VKRISKKKKRISRRRFVRGVVLGTMGFCTACAIDAWGVEPEWVEVVERELKLKKLPRGFHGKKIIQISDLHLSTTVSKKYLKRCVRRVNMLGGDMVVLTGDYVTLDRRGSYKEKVIELLGGLESPLGVYACLGNHDYGVTSNWRRSREDWAQYLSEGMARRGINVLRNKAEFIQIGNDKICLVGLGDMWAGDMHIEKGFEGVGEDVTTIVLVHNPDSIEQLQERKTDAILCGHTHGGQVRVPFLGPPILPIKNRQYYAGMFEVGDTTLYVNRGLGRLGRLRFNCRPEITVFTLKGEEG